MDYNMETGLPIIAAAVQDAIENNDNKNILICVAGGSGGGKTTLSTEIINYLGPDRCVLLHLDHFMNKLNYDMYHNIDPYKWDDPKKFYSFDLVNYLNQLINGKTILAKQYCAYNKSVTGVVEIQPKPIIILEGIYSFYFEQIRKLSDINIYLKDYPYARFAKRITRTSQNLNSFEIGDALDNLLGPILQAHLDCVSSQIENADLLFYIPFNLSFHNHLIDNTNIKFSYIGNPKPIETINLFQNEIKFLLYETEMDGSLELWLDYLGKKIRLCSCTSKQFETLRSLKGLLKHELN